MRTLIIGGPKTGKTTLSQSYACPVRHTDDLIGKLDWSAASAEVATWFDAPGPWCIEGVAVVRALRKWLATHPDGTPADRILFLTEPKIPVTAGQAAMTKGIDTVWEEIEGDLLLRGVDITKGTP